MQPGGGWQRRQDVDYLGTCAEALSGKWTGSRSGERRGERGEDAEVGVKRKPIQAAYRSGFNPYLFLSRPKARSTVALPR
jgi:hypothetical protein